MQLCLLKALSCSASFLFDILKPFAYRAIDASAKYNTNCIYLFTSRIAIAGVWGDYHLTCPTILMQEMLAKHEPNNHYYAYRTMQSSPSPLGYPMPWLGVLHGQSGLFMFTVQLLQRSEDQQISRDIIQAWANFAKTGVVGKISGDITWEEAFEKDSSEKVTRYMSLNVADYKMVGEHYRQRCDQFWKDRITQ